MFIYSYGPMMADADGDGGGGGDDTRQTQLPLTKPDVVPKASYDDINAKYNDLLQKDVDRKTAADIEKAKADGQLDVVNTKLIDDNKALMAQINKRNDQDKALADTVFGSLPEDVQGRFGKIKDSMDSATWLQFIQTEAAVYAAGGEGEPGEGEPGDDTTTGGTNLRPAKPKGSPLKKLNYDLDAVVALADELGRETKYLPNMNIDRDKYEGSNYSLKKPFWLAALKGKTDHGEKMDEATARSILQSGRMQSVRPPADNYKNDNSKK